MTQTELCHGKLMIIAHPEIGVQEISPHRLKQLYLNRSKKWADGSSVHLTILVNKPATTVFITQHLGKSTTQFKRYWKQQLFSGKGIPPEYFKTLRKLLLYIRTTKGAIGFIDCTTPPKGVTMIRLVE